MFIHHILGKSFQGRLLNLPCKDFHKIWWSYKARNEMVWEEAKTNKIYQDYATRVALSYNFLFQTNRKSDMTMKNFTRRKELKFFTNGAKPVASI